ncbi:MAG: helix-hairpin-helix domain-containing protein, partial [Lentisphaeria bacterium]
MILETKIKGIRYEKKGDEQTFYILETDAGIMKGKAYFELQKDKCIKAEGSWVVSKFNGKNEFYFKSVIPSLPIAPKSKFDYACSITKGIGEKLQAKIWETLIGDWEHIDIKTVDGVGDAIADEWKVTLAEIKNMGQQADLFAWMGQIGMTANMCAAAWTKWGKECGGVIYNNPYKLAELPRYGFLIVDKMVLDNETWEIGQTDQRRVVAAILYILDENA